MQFGGACAGACSCCLRWQCRYLQADKLLDRSDVLVMNAIPGAASLRMPGHSRLFHVRHGRRTTRGHAPGWHGAPQREGWTASSRTRGSGAAGGSTRSTRRAGYRRTPFHGGRCRRIAQGRCFAIYLCAVIGTGQPDRQACGFCGSPGRGHCTNLPQPPRHHAAPAT